MFCPSRQLLSQWPPGFPEVTGQTEVEAQRGRISRKPFPSPKSQDRAELAPPKVRHQSKTRDWKADLTWAMVSIMPQVEEAHAGGRLLHGDGDEVGCDVCDKDVLDETAGRFPVLAGLDSYGQVLPSTGK